MQELQPGPSRTRWEFSASQNERVFAFLLRLSQEVQPLLDLPRLLQKLLDVLGEIQNYHHSLIYLQDGMTKEVVVEEAVGYMASQKGHRQSGDDGSVGWVLHNNKSAHLPIAGSGFPLREDGSDPGRARILVPLAADGKTFGVLDIGSEPGSPFTEEEVVFLELLAPYVSTLLAVTLAHQQEHQASVRDWLTGIYNQRYFYERFEEEFSRARRYHHSLTIGILDVDNLKGVNDTNGHLAGDQVLRTVAQTLRNGLRASDLVARYGGDEFSIIMVETGLATATVVAERLVGMVERESFSVGGATCPLPHLSWGLATFPEDADRTTTLLEVADRRLYEAKWAKRASPPPSPTPPPS